MNDANAKTVKAALHDFRISTCTSLHSTGVDATDEILPMVYAISTMLEMGFRKDFDGEALFDSVNPALVASALGGIARLTAFALFTSDARAS